MNEYEKYKALFVFGSEEELKAEVENNEEFQKFVEKEAKLSELLREAAPFIEKREQKETFRKSVLKVACALFAVVFIGIGTMFYNGVNTTDLAYENSSLNSIIDSYGLPTDDYGFFDYE